jgi:UDP-2,4-diacetamido-2,4,6-trideoxy-beta-L-idose 2-epimerase
MIKIAVFTGTRAEYGLLYWLMQDIAVDPDLHLQIIAGAMHLSPEFGLTWKEITDDGFSIDAKVEMLLSSDTPVGVAKSIGLGTIGFADALERLDPDILIVLGDRFEALSIVQAALIMRIPIAHIHGGEITQGAYDDAIRHAITKMSNLHFVASEPYARRVIQMGTLPERVFNVGAVGLDHLRRGELLDQATLEDELKFKLGTNCVLVTYHPVTMGDEDPVATTSAILAALDAFQDYKVILTFPNADNGGRAIIPLLKAYAEQNPNRVLALPSLGFRRYKAVLSKVSAVIGNSSSGLIEAPSFSVPTVNVGLRQIGRLAGPSVLHCSTDQEHIRKSISQALSPAGQAIARAAHNPYGRGNASGRIIEAIKANPGPFPQIFHNIEFAL